ncbi:MAG: hypothetical protein HY769_05225 [Candidatus Stahlbacteria bacterium]|nr:hypothetical protein [Candidatus Stahlbacteria bacterium]
MKELQNISQKLLQEKKVEFIIGYAKGTLPLCSTPIVITNDKECGNLIFDLTCGNNLATYLVKHRKPITDNCKPIGVVAKGCDGRSIVQYIVEGQIKRENVVIIGVPCKGVVDFKKVREKIGEREILDYRIAGDKILLEGKDLHISLSTQEILDDGCLFCKYPKV